MLQESQTPGTGLFQYTKPLRDSSDDLALPSVANAINAYANDAVGTKSLIEASSAKEQTNSDDGKSSNSSCSTTRPSLHTLDFVPGTLSIFAGSKSLHRVTKVEGKKSRLVAVFTFASQPGFQNTPTIQNMFWGRSSSVPRRRGQKEAEENQ